MRDILVTVDIAVNSGDVTRDMPGQHFRRRRQIYFAFQKLTNEKIGGHEQTGLTGTSRDRFDQL